MTILLASTVDRDISRVQFSSEKVIDENILTTKISQSTVHVGTMYMYMCTCILLFIVHHCCLISMHRGHECLTLLSPGGGGRESQVDQEVTNQYGENEHLCGSINSLSHSNQ